jgi:hypothetical protein
MQVGDLATWIGSVGIVATLAATAWQLRRERSIRRQDKYRTQAVRISAWYGGEYSAVVPIGHQVVGSSVRIANGSDLPVYEVVATLVFIQGSGPKTSEEMVAHDAQGPSGRHSAVLGAVGPGNWTVAVDNDWHGMMAHVGAEIAFTDTRGTHWVRRANGSLEQLQTGAIDHYRIGRPVDYTEPEPA